MKDLLKRMKAVKKDRQNNLSTRLIEGDLDQLIELVERENGRVDTLVRYQNSDLDKLDELAKRDECYCSDNFDCDICRASRLLNEIEQLASDNAMN